MKSNDTTRIIKQIAAEEGLSPWAIRLIVTSQFEGVTHIMRSATPDDLSTFVGIRLNAFGLFKVIRHRFNKFKGREKYEQEKRRRYDAKHKSK